MIFTLLTLYTLRGPMLNGEPPHRGAIAAPAYLLDSGRVHLGQKVCVRFQGGDRKIYVVEDRTADSVTVWDIWVPVDTRVKRCEVENATLTIGRCK